MSAILIVEDVAALAEQYAYDLARLGSHRAWIASSVPDALETLARVPIDCVLLDLELPGADGFELLKRLRGTGEPVPVIVYTGTGDYARCVRAVKLGAFGFLDKSEPMERVLREIENALERGRLEREVSSLREKLDVESSMVGESRAMRTLKETIARLAPIPSPVLVRGESGTGKELVARDLHRVGPRASSPFLAVNCAALPEHLVESELFGHEKGAFTGADRTRRGAFETASGGTLFLDEVGELAAPVQAKLLRVLEQSEVTRVGASETVAIDTRIVAATNRDLEREVSDGRFREDLLYRLNVHGIEVPPLRERLSDVPALVDHFLRITAERFGRRTPAVTEEAVETLRRHTWERNNVRELRNTVERMMIASDGDRIGVDSIPAEIADGGLAAPGSGGGAPGRGAADRAGRGGRGGTLQERKARAERAIVLEALERNDWHVTHTAADLGLADHASLSKIMKRLGLRRGSG